MLVEGPPKLGEMEVMRFRGEVCRKKMIRRRSRARASAGNWSGASLWLQAVAKARQRTIGWILTSERLKGLVGIDSR